MSITLRPSPDEQPPARLFEWLMTAAMFGIVGLLLFDPSSLAKGLFRYLYAMGIGPYMLSAILAGAGSMRLIGLWRNGRWQHSSKLRFIGCAVGGVTWMHMALALVAVTREITYISPGIPVYAVLCIGEILSCYRAAFDDRTTIR